MNACPEQHKRDCRRGVGGGALRPQEGDDGADEVQRFVGVDPVAGVGDVLDIGAREEPLDFRVVFGAAGKAQ